MQFFVRAKKYDKKSRKKYNFVFVMRYVLHTLLLAFSLLSGLATVSAQQAPILFEEPKWNFGDVQESGGSVEHTFVFTNVSDRPVVIVDVSTGCGCTTPKYSRKPVLAGAKGEIVVAFDPINRPGHFSKGVSVMTSASKEPVLLQVEGNVVPREKTLEELFPVDMGGGVRFDSTSVPLPMSGAVTVPMPR